MENGFYIVENISSISNDENSLVANIDGTKIQNMDDFYAAFNEHFEFPDYFGENTEAFYELMNDLDWLEKSSFVICISNYDSMLSEDKDEKLMCLEMLYQTALEWQEVPNFEGEEEFRSAADFKIYIEKNSSILADLKEMEINEGVYIQ